VAAVSEDDIRHWLRHWDRSRKTKANYHGLIHAVFAYAVRRRYRDDTPCQGTAPRRRTVRADSPEHGYLTEAEFVLLAAQLRPEARDLVTVALATGLRFGEITALWVDDVDPDSARPDDKGAGKFGDWLDSDADQAWRAANQEALDLGHTWVGTEHLLLGLMRRPADDPTVATLAARGVTADRVRGALIRDLGAATQLDAKGMLATLGVNLDAVRASVEENFGPDAIDALYARRRRDGHRLARGPLCGMALAPPAKQALERARRAAKTDLRPAASTSALLAGLLAVEDGMAIRLLRQLGVDPVELRVLQQPRAAG
jgi:hypothetical protein